MVVCSCCRWRRATASEPERWRAKVVRIVRNVRIERLVQNDPNDPNDPNDRHAVPPETAIANAASRASTTYAPVKTSARLRVERWYSTDTPIASTTIHQITNRSMIPRNLASGDASSSMEKNCTIVVGLAIDSRR